MDNSLGRPTWEQPHEAWMNNLQNIKIQHVNTNVPFANIANSQKFALWANMPLSTKGLFRGWRWKYANTHVRFLDEALVGAAK